MEATTTEPEFLAERAPTSEAAHRLAARFAQLNLDAGTLELLLAVLTTDVCDHLAVETGDL